MASIPPVQKTGHVVNKSRLKSAYFPATALI
jgi:hypothetical protein